jgi:hypothetical protein
VNRVLQNLASRGVIKIDGQTIALLDIAALQRRASVE